MVDIPSFPPLLQLDLSFISIVRLIGEDSWRDISERKSAGKCEVFEERERKADI